MTTSVRRIMPDGSGTPTYPPPGNVETFARMVLGDHAAPCPCPRPSTFAVGWRPGVLLCDRCFATDVRSHGASTACDNCGVRERLQPIEVEAGRLLLVADLCDACWSAVAGEEDEA